MVRQTQGGLERRNIVLVDSWQLKPIEKAKIDCAKKLFNELSTSHVKYHNVDSYQNLLAVMNTL